MPQLGRIIADTTIPQVGLSGITAPRLPVPSESPAQPAIDGLREFSNRLLQAELTVKETELTMEATQRLRGLRKSITEQVTNPDSYGIVYEKEYAQIEKDILKKAGLNQMLRASVSANIKRLGTETRIHVDADAIERRVDNYRALLGRDLHEISKSLPQTSNEIERAGLRAKGEGLITAFATANRTFSPVAIEAMRIKFDEDVELAQKKHIKTQAQNLALLEPDKAMELALNPEAFEAKFPGANMNEFIGIAFTSRNRIEAEREKQEAERQGVADIQLLDDIINGRIRSENEIIQKAREGGLSENQIEGHRRNFRGEELDRYRAQNVEQMIIGGQFFKEEDYAKATEGLGAPAMKELLNLKTEFANVDSHSKRLLTSSYPELKTQTQKGQLLIEEITNRIRKGEPAQQVVADLITQKESRNRTRENDVRISISRIPDQNFKNPSKELQELMWELEILNPELHDQLLIGEVPRLLTPEETARQSKPKESKEKHIRTLGVSK